MFIDALRSHRCVTFVLAENLGEHCGLTNLDQAVIFLDARSSPGEMFATLAHELRHLCRPDCDDDEIEAWTAELLVPLPDALAAQAAGDLQAVAEWLGVDTQLVRARLRCAPVQVVGKADGVG